jgi:hypothetical protein
MDGKALNHEGAKGAKKFVIDMNFFAPFAPSR